MLNNELYFTKPLLFRMQCLHANCRVDAIFKTKLSNNSNQKYFLNKKQNIINNILIINKMMIYVTRKLRYKFTQFQTKLVLRGQGLRKKS